jgi:phosphatidylinositol kinase/protein kinase (PI-3  family)
MKTALTELTEDIEQRLVNIKNPTAEAIWQRALGLIKEKLPQERQQIEDANIAGMEFIYFYPNRHKEDAANYYTQTYEQ